MSVTTETSNLLGALETLRRAAGVLLSRAWFGPATPEQAHAQSHLAGELLAQADDLATMGVDAPEDGDEVSHLRAQVVALREHITQLIEGDAQVAALAGQVVARQRAESEAASLRDRLEALTGEGQVRLVRLSHLHARFHDRPGDLMGDGECGLDGCAFWPAAAFTLDHLAV